MNGSSVIQVEAQQLYFWESKDIQKLQIVIGNC